MYIIIIKKNLKSGWIYLLQKIVTVLCAGDKQRFVAFEVDGLKGLKVEVGYANSTIIKHVVLLKKDDARGSPLVVF